MSRLNFLSRQDAIKRMNYYGRRGIPFFFLIDFDEDSCIVEEPRNLPDDEIWFSFPSGGNYDEIPSTMEKDFVWKPFPQTIEEYSSSFDTVYRNLYAGNSFLTNLTCATPVGTDLTLEDIFIHSHAKYRLLMRGRFVMFSPEIFVRIEDGMIYSYPMKGTIDASYPDAVSVILNDEKESAEHATIVDLIRNDLSQIASEVTVTKYRYIDEVHTNNGTLLQVSSEIRGRLPDDFRDTLGDMFFRLLPAGSVTGAPKKKTVEIIREAETYDRGYYTGVTGFFNGKNLDSAVIIRFVEQQPDGTMVFKSGGGITFKSDMRSEYEEMIQKVYVPFYRDNMYK